MKRINILIFIALVFITTTSFFSEDVVLYGKISGFDPAQKIRMKGIKLFAKYRGKLVAETTSDRSGNYEITINVGLGNGIKDSYDFYISNKNADTCFLRSFKQFNGTDVKWNIRLPKNCAIK